MKCQPCKCCYANCYANRAVPILLVCSGLLSRFVWTGCFLSNFINTTQGIEVFNSSPHICHSTPLPNAPVLVGTSSFWWTQVGAGTELTQIQSVSRHVTMQERRNQITRPKACRDQTFGFPSIAYTRLDISERTVINYSYYSWLVGQLDQFLKR